MRVKLRNGGVRAGSSNSRSGSGGDTALAEISSKYAKSRPGRPPRGLSITTGGWHSVQNLWICKRRPGIKTRLQPSFSFLSLFENVSNGISARILDFLVSWSHVPNYYFPIYLQNSRENILFDCTSKWVTDRREKKMFSVQSVIRFLSNFYSN